MHLSGQLSDWSINDLLQIMQVTKKTGSLDIEGERRGRVHFREGRVTGAELTGFDGAHTGSDRAGVADILYVLSSVAEGSFSVGAGNTIRLYRYALAGADDVSGVADLDDAAPVREAGKELVLDLDSLVASEGLTLDNIEGMTLGPRLPDGGRALLLVSDNNFTPGQVSQFLLFSADGVGPAA